MPRRAFTLIELLVVIAVIGLLGTIAVVAMNNARAQARNTKRIADLKQYMTAFSMAYINSGGYPASGDACISSSCYGLWSGINADLVDVDPFFASYLSPKPVDPVGGSRARGGYIFTGNWAGGSHNGYYFPAGPIISYSLEKAINCPFGQPWMQSGVETECVVNLSL